MGNTTITPELASAHTSDLENRIMPAAQVLGQTLQSQQQPATTTSGLDQTVGPQTTQVGGPYSAAPQQSQQLPQVSTPFDQLIQDRLNTMQTMERPRPGGIRGLLTNFFQGAGDAMKRDVGLPTEFQQRQQLANELIQLNAGRDQWINTMSEGMYRQALVQGMNQPLTPEQAVAIGHGELAGQVVPAHVLQNIAEQSNLIQRQTQFNAQQPQLQIPLDAGTAKLAGIPDSFVGKNLGAADWHLIDSFIGAKGYSRFDTGRDGTGVGNGIWIIDRGGNPVHQISTLSESKRQLAVLNQGLQLPQQQQTAQMLVEGQLDPSQLSPRSKDYGQILNLANAYSQQTYGQPFNVADAAIQFKYAQNPTTQNTLKYLDSLTGPDNKSGNLGELINLSNGIGRTRFPALNDVAAWTRLQSGSPQMAQYYTAVTEVSDQVAKILQGGGSGAGTSDAKLKQAAELFRTGFSADQISAVASTLRDLLGNRKGAMIQGNRYLQKQFGSGATAPTQPPAQFNWNNFPKAD
jgi:hypothetical protein